MAVKKCSKKTAVAMARDLKMKPCVARCFEYMLRYGGITSLQSYVDLGETRLSARIYDMKENLAGTGMYVSCAFITVKNRFGEARRIKKYWVCEGA